MIEPVEKTFELPNGEQKVFTLHKFDAIAGREIITQYPISGLPKLGDYETNEAIVMKMMKYVGVKTNAGPLLMLSTRELVNNHIPSWEVLAKIEWAMIEYNCSFFADGSASSFLEDLLQKLPQLISSMLTDLLEHSSQKDKPHSTS